ncbi:protein-disulfide reductase DsbD [Fulvimarina endophytica]|uniref:Protein-disulfide reductase DsbD n=1 Tax=Fulvimarina endophytica TaxID=2293836 RepID=A0A371X5L6_9HYPH|nr:protein-disulfide reductase DsbD [Fulvimarina endophytica]RFC64507.1 protein-disulfide reductase DsbD [Fulvimarina endophytica]
MRGLVQSIGVVIAGFVLTAAPALAQPNVPLHVDKAFALSAEQGPAGAVDLDWAIAEGYYLYRDRIELKTADGASLPLETPEGEPKDDPYFGRMEIYHGAASASIAPSVLERLGDGATLSVTYQGCQDDGICYAPETKSFDPMALAAGPVAFGETASSPGDPMALLGRELSQEDTRSSSASGWSFAQDAPVTARPAEPPSVVSNLPEEVSRAPQGGSTGIVTDASAGGLVAGLVSQGGAPFAIGAFFLLGLGLAFTPCVFPMYPILAGQLGRVGAERSAVRGALHSSAYVLSMAVAFGLLGVAAAWSGQNLQIALQSPLAVGLVSALFLLLALAMFGAFALKLPDGWVNGVNRIMPNGRGGLASTAGLGFLSALIVGPCVTAPLAGALLYIGQTGDVALGAASLFALGLGQGVPLIAFGTFGSRIMPKAGPWMKAVNIVFGFVFLALSVWMVSRIVEPWIAVGLWGLLGLSLAIALGAVAGGETATSLKVSTARLAGLVALVLGGTLLVGAAAGAKDPFRPLEPLTGGRVVAGGQAPLEFTTIGGPADLAQRISDVDRSRLLYFTADWCVSCDIIEREIFEDPAVRERLADVDLMKVDLTSVTPGHDLLMKQLSVVGPPTMLFIGKNGTEAEGTRAVGELSAEGFLTRAGRI